MVWLDGGLVWSLGYVELVASTGAVWWLVVLVWLYSFSTCSLYRYCNRCFSLKERHGGSAAKYI